MGHVRSIMNHLLSLTEREFYLSYHTQEQLKGQDIVVIANQLSVTLVASECAVETFFYICQSRCPIICT